MEEARFSFVFENRTNPNAPASDKSGGPTPAKPTQRDGGEAVDRATDRNERATGGGSGSSRTMPGGSGSFSDSDSGSRRQPAKVPEVGALSPRKLFDDVRGVAASAKDVITGRSPIDAALHLAERTGSLAAQLSRISFGSKVPPVGASSPTTVTPASLPPGIDPSKVIAAEGSTALTAEAGAARGAMTIGSRVPAVGASSSGMGVAGTAATIALPVAFAAAVYGGGAYAAHKYTSPALSTRANDLASYSPEVARANAMADVQRAKDNIRDANDPNIAGPAARFIESQTAFESMKRRAGNVLVKNFGDEVNAVQDIGTIVGDAITKGFDAVVSTTLEALKINLKNYGIDVKAIEKELHDIAKKLTGMDNTNWMTWFENEKFIFPPGWDQSDIKEEATVFIADGSPFGR